MCKLTWIAQTLRPQWNKIDDQTIKESCFAVEKASSSNHRTGRGPIQHIFS